MHFPKQYRQWLSRSMIEQPYMKILQPWVGSSVDNLIVILFNISYSKEIFNYHFYISLFVFLRYLPFVVRQRDNMPTVQANKLQNLDNSRIQPTAALLQNLLLLRPKHFESKLGKILVRHYYQSNYCYFGRSSDSLVLCVNRKCIKVNLLFNRNDWIWMFI